MKKVSGNNRLKRVIAGILAILLSITSIQSYSVIVKADDPVNASITITVKDGENNPVEGARVEYNIPEKKEGENVIFPGKRGTEVTNDEGKATIAFENYVGGLAISATVSKGGYKSETISEQDIISYTDNMDMTLLKFIDLGNLSVKGYSGEYDGTPYPAVTTENADGKDYILQYKLDEGSDEGSWSDSIPEVTKAGSYTVSVKATQPNFAETEVPVVPGDGAESPANVIVKQKKQSGFSFDNFSGESSSYELTQTKLETGETYDFTASYDDSDSKVSSGITYSIDLDENDGNIASIDSTGELTVKGVGQIKVKAKYEDTDGNYESSEISHVLNISGKKENDGDWISVTESTIDYKLGDNAGILSNTVTKKNEFDNGTISYSIENGTELGLNIDTSGVVSISDYAKLANSLESNSGALNVTVNANKAEGIKSGGNKYPSDSVSYTLNISTATAPTDAIKVYSVEDEETELTEANGPNDWYNTVLVVKPIDGYEIIRADGLKGPNPIFSEKVKFGETVGDDVLDQGAEDVRRYIYLKNISSGEITEKIDIGIDKLDTDAPKNLKIEFPEPNKKVDILKYYGKPVTITFIAYDDASGVKEFTWEYNKTADASTVNLENLNGIAIATKDASDPTKYIGKITIPEDQAKQLRGNLQVKAKDNADHESNFYTDGGVFVVDTISPTQTVEYGLKNNNGTSRELGNNHYFSDTVEFSFKITEANFYPEDVVITVKKDDEEAQTQSLRWSKTGIQDQNQAILTLLDDGHYIVKMTYTDRSGQTMTSYTSKTIIIDREAPTIDVKYSKEDNTYNNKNFYSKDLKATFTITERNFDKDNVIILALKDGIEKKVNVKWEDKSQLVHVGTVVIDAKSNHSNDGDYVFKVEYIDFSDNNMTAYKSNTKVIDTTKPVIKVNYKNKNVINKLKDSQEHQRKYYDATQTAEITITEHNFNPKDVKYTIIAKDVTGKELNAKSLYNTSSWKRDKDKNTLTITYPGNANYTFDIEYTDLATLNASKYKTDYFTVDKLKPNNLNVSYSNSILDTVLEAVTFGFYNAKTTVTISARDNISGINSMQYSYLKADGVSSINAELENINIDASSIVVSEDGAVGTSTFEIPRSALEGNTQFNGSVNFIASDRANNESDYLRDTKRIVVDNIAPTAEVEYNSPVQTANGIAYYDGDITATITVNEANFYSEDIQISVTRDGAASAVNVNWSDNSPDVHVGSFTLSEDGDYVVNIEYTDKSTNTMEVYTSEQLTIDTEIIEPVITVNGQEADGKAFKDEVVPAVSYDDINFEACEVKIFRTSFADKNVDVSEKFLAGSSLNGETGGNSRFANFEKIAENDGIYTITAELRDKVGHSVETSSTFTVNRFGSVYEYNDFLVSLISDGGAYVQNVDNDLVITEYNADKLVSNSLNIEVLRDGKPLGNPDFKVSPNISDAVSVGTSGWYQYAYTIDKDNFDMDGVYKVEVSSKDATGNSPEIDNYEDKNILFRVDSTVPEITSVTGLEEPVVNATEQTVKYTVFDTIGLDSVVAYVDGKEVENVTDFSSDANNYEGTIALKESSNSQKVRLLVTDKAGNVTDTDSEGFTSSYNFSDTVTISTNALVRWYANKPLFFGTIGAGVIVIGGAGGAVFFRRRRIKVSK